MRLDRRSTGVVLEGEFMKPIGTVSRHVNQIAGSPDPPVRSQAEEARARYR
jgi:hypothetical protein